MSDTLPLRSRTSLLVDAFIQMTETDFTKSVLIPLLESVGYARVEHHGGPYEHGKDIIFSKSGELTGMNIAVAQVKKYRMTARSGDSESFAEIARQLIQAADEPVIHLDGNTYLPSKVYFMTPYPLDTRALRTAFSTYCKLVNVEVLDGIKIAELVWERIPRLANAILGQKQDIQLASRSNLSNDVLLAAIGCGKGRAVKEFFTDIGLTLGRITSRLFFSGEFLGTKISLTLTYHAWLELSRICELIEEKFDEAIIPNHCRAEHQLEFEAAHQRFQEARNQAESTARAYLAACEELSSLKESLDEQDLASSSSGDANITRCLTTLKQAIQTISLLGNPVLSHPQDAVSFLTNALETLTEYRVSTNSTITNSNSGASDFRLQLIADKLRAAVRLGPPVPIPAEPLFAVSIDGRQFSLRLKDIRDAIRSELSRFERQEPTSAELRGFIDYADQVFESTKVVLGNPHVCLAVGISLDQKYQLQRDALRISCPIDKVLSCGANLSIFGEAGAGKSTTMQMYAAKLLEHSPNLLALYVPLGAMTRNWFDRCELKKTELPDLVEGIGVLLTDLGAQVTTESLHALLESEESVVLFDGIDEVIGSQRWIVAAIAHFTTRFPRAQVLTSARMTGDYVEDIPFVPVTLQPFTIAQRAKFVRAWFGDSANANSEAIRTHLQSNQKLCEVTRNPLLATVLCTLQDRGVPLPQSEVMLYEERMRLLLGDYDVKKLISRTSTDRQTLEMLTRRLAFELHVAETREKPRSWFVDRAKYYITKRGRGGDGEKAILELVESCGILVPMTSSGDLGFGHLRYQEFLVAKQASVDRFVDLRKYMGNRWWLDVLYLFSQLTDDMENQFLFLVGDQLGDGARIHSISALINGRPEHERDALNELLKAHGVRSGAVRFDQR